MTAALTIARVEDVSLSPARAEVRLHVAAEGLASLPAGVEWRGRLTGPRCRYATTVEVAYPVRPAPGAGPGVLRVVIPEPNWWDPAAPFLYEGPVEAWHGGAVLARAAVRHGLRTLRLTEKGLLVNGRPTPLRAAPLPAGDTPEEGLARLREQGYNAVLLPPGGGAAWDAADRVGLLALARAASPAEVRQLADLLTSGRHPSALAGLLPASLAAAPPPGGLWGLELDPPSFLPPWAAFAVAVAPAPPGLPPRPTLVRTADGWHLPAG